MSNVERAVEYFGEGFNCSQSLCTAFAEEIGVDRDSALKIAAGFGGGMGRMAGTCGAVTGAFLVIGLKYGRIKAEDIEAKEKTYEFVLEFVKRFKSLNGSINCTELLGYDLGSPEGMKLAEEKELFTTVCPKLVQNAAEIIEQIL